MVKSIYTVSNHYVYSSDLVFNKCVDFILHAFYVQAGARRAEEWTTSVEECDHKGIKSSKDEDQEDVRNTDITQYFRLQKGALVATFEEAQREILKE